MPKPVSMDIDWDSLDPGIREKVRFLRMHGFETTDSGDGVSKPAEWFEIGEALPFPHIAIVIDDRAHLPHEARFVKELLGTGWEVDGSYSTKDGKAILFARKELASAE